jgi:sulfate adenylyltransferase subunit 1 (EFTu-like GTPase family)
MTSNARALRFLTAGSVDDGKSTLIGRLLFDSQASWPTSSTRWNAAPPARRSTCRC